MTTTIPPTDDPPAIDLDAIRARHAKATPGPWGHGSDWSHFAVAQVGENGGWTFRVIESANQSNTRSRPGFPDYFGVVRLSDAVFIAHARTDIPALCREVAALRAEVERLREIEGIYEGLCK